MPKKIIQEGETKLAVPYFSEPKMLPAFFNPKGNFVREVSIACYQAFGDSRKKLQFADALGGIGARGIRVANEIPSFSTVFLNDINSNALKFGRASAKLNGVEKKCVFSKAEACSFLVSREANGGERFDCVDIDPFGTPSDYVDCAIRAVRDGGMLSLTATDSAVLCGVYPKVALRKYLGAPLRTDYSDEVGMRLLFGLASMTAMRLETGIMPLFCHHDKHYFRVYFTVRVGNSFSRENEREIGFLRHCFACGFRDVVPREEFGRKSEGIEHLVCPLCLKNGKRSRLSIGGPCWSGKIESKDFVSACRESQISVFLGEELDLPLYYDLAATTKKLGTRTPRINDAIEKLQSIGYHASRTRLNPGAVRTDAGIEALLSVVGELVQ
ncbi:MAG TPA: hypothetical protein VJN71_04850 [Nitrososphaerales archaeon]|nr:hypothetical protein [Nitrososphaerales archaeon]